MSVVITIADGTAVEEGAETPSNSGHWVYAATATVQTWIWEYIEVTATDRPRYKGVKSVDR